MKLTPLLSLAALAAAPTLAQAAPPAGPLDPLVGTWKGTGTATMGADHAPVRATWRCAKVSAGAGVECRLKLTGIPGLAYEETDLFGVDPGTGRLHWFAVTNAGETHDHSAAAGEGAWRFAFDGTQDGKPVHEAITLTLAADRRSFTLVSQVTVGGQAVAGFDVTARK